MNMSINIDKLHEFIFKADDILAKIRDIASSVERLDTDYKNSVIVALDNDAFVKAFFYDLEKAANFFGDALDNVITASEELN